MRLNNLEKPSPLQIAQREGFTVKRSGKAYRANCFRHADKTPSLFIYDDHVHCYSCSFHADSIALVMELHGLSFKEALAYLGLSDSAPTFNRTQIQRTAEDKALVSAFNGDCKRITNNLYDLLRRVDRLKMKARTMADIEKLSFWYHKEPIWEHWISILEGNDDKAKYELWREVRNGAV